MGVDKRGMGLSDCPGGGETVLLAEDDEIVSSLAERVLKDRGYQVLVVASGAEAIATYAAAGAVDLLITDIMMPQMGGGDLFCLLRGKSPELKVLFISGYTEDVLAECGQSGMLFLQKPFSLECFTRAVRDALDG